MEMTTFVAGAAIITAALITARARGILWPEIRRLSWANGAGDGHEAGDGYGTGMKRLSFLSIPVLIFTLLFCTAAFAQRNIAIRLQVV